MIHTSLTTASTTPYNHNQQGKSVRLVKSLAAAAVAVSTFGLSGMAMPAAADSAPKSWDGDRSVLGEASYSKRGIQLKHYDVHLGQGAFGGAHIVREVPLPRGVLFLEAFTPKSEPRAVEYVVARFNYAGEIQGYWIDLEVRDAQRQTVRHIQGKAKYPSRATSGKTGYEFPDRVNIPSNGSLCAVLYNHSINSDGQSYVKTWKRVCTRSMT